MVSKYEKLLSWLGLPIYIWQGLATQKRTKRIPPPDAPAFVDIKGKGKPIRLLMIGDSTIAGVGVKDFRDSVAGATPYKLAKITGRPVTCHTNGNSSATAGTLRDYAVPNIEHAEYDYVFLSFGVNDSKNFHTGRRFCKEFGTLIYAIRARFPTAKLIWSGIVDIGDIPVLPSPLNKILSIRSRILKNIGLELCFERGVLAPESKWRALPENFSEDRFHCSNLGYLEWADELSNYLAYLETETVQQSENIE